jgi:uncharacterized protein YbjT (DUF2867 family)
MNVILTGATGMVGEGVLLECLENPAVNKVLVVGRKPYHLTHPKLSELIVPDFLTINDYTGKLSDYDACFFCAGISSVGMNEEKYTKITYDTTLAFAKTVLAQNPNLVFTYVSGRSTDSSEKGNMMWARVKGKTENDLMKLGFKGVYNFRPALMIPTPGQKSIGTFQKILFHAFKYVMEKTSIPLKDVGRAMIHAVQRGYSKQVLEVEDIRALAK